MSDYTQLYRKYLLSSRSSLIYCELYKPSDMASLVKTALTVSDICTNHLISPLSNNSLVVEEYISYVEHVHQMLTFLYHVLHEEKHLGNFLFGLMNKNKRVLIIRHWTIATPHKRENR